MISGVSRTSRLGGGGGIDFERNFFVEIGFLVIQYDVYLQVETQFLDIRDTPFICM